MKGIETIPVGKFVIMGVNERKYLLNKINELILEVNTLRNTIKAQQAIIDDHETKIYNLENPT